jgi:predicted metalloprotease with PDZ domain
LKTKKAAETIKVFTTSPALSAHCLLLAACCSLTVRREIQIIARPLLCLKITLALFAFNLLEPQAMTTHKHSGRLLLTTTLLTLLLLTVTVSAASTEKLSAINYRLRMSKPVSHLFEVSIEAQLPEGETAEYLDFQMPRWSPGRYSVFDFAKNVQEVQAASGICPQGAKCKMAALPVTRLDNQTWRVPLLGGRSMTLRYKVFGDDLSGTFSQLDDRHANINGASVFMYIVNHKQDPVLLSIYPPNNWRIINGRTGRADEREWRFENYDLLIDTPTEIAPDWTLDEFKIDGKTYRVVLHSFGAEGGKRAELVRDLEKIVRAETRMWGAPEFDAYTFLIHFAADDRSGDGMEHLTSTQIIEPGALSETNSYQGALGTAAHEFFHVWNVKRLRPVELGPWDFTRPLNTRVLWIAEGFTTYYGNLMLRRAGIRNDAQLFSYLGALIGGIENAPGSRLMSAEASSLSAPFIDGEIHEQRTNLGNTAVSYYPKGATLGLVLDLTIRRMTEGRASLDDVLRRMYEEFYLKSEKATYYLRGRGYTSEDFERVATAVAGADLSDFFNRYVRGVETPPYEDALAGVGLRLRRTPASEPYRAGLSLDGESMVITNVRQNTAAEDGGLKQGDVLLSIGDKKVTGETWTGELGRYKRNQIVPIAVKRDRRTIKTVIKIGQPERYDYHVEERPDASAQARRLRAAWLEN